MEVGRTDDRPFLVRNDAGLHSREGCRHKLGRLEMYLGNIQQDHNGVGGM